MAEEVALRTGGIREMEKRPHTETSSPAVWRDADNQEGDVYEALLFRSDSEKVSRVG